MQPIVLASRSPRRTQLLDMLGILHEVVPSSVDETPHRGESPVAYVARVAAEKAQSVALENPGSLILGADTTVVLGGEALGKPTGPADAESMLTRLAGRSHEVLSAVALVGGERLEQAVDTTRVTFRPVDTDFIASYVATGEPLDKAGAYGIQGFGAALVERIEGDFFGVMGLPVRLVLELLDRFGVRYHFTR